MRVATEVLDVLCIEAWGKVATEDVLGIRLPPVTNAAKRLTKHMFVKVRGASDGIGQNAARFVAGF
jgi:hypothetical protein